jgi:predicted TIM-barrel fold metal-dependent hydrolase
VTRVDAHLHYWCLERGDYTWPTPRDAALYNDLSFDALVRPRHLPILPNRIMWGSDWPVVTSHTPYEQWLEMALELVHRHASGHEEAVFAGNATRFYRLVDRERLTCP